MANETGQMLAAGTLTIAALRANNAYRVDNFPTDEPYESWSIETTGVVQYFTRQTVALGGLVSSYGDIVLPDFVFLITNTQLTYITGTILGDSETGAITTQFYDFKRDEWNVFNAVIRLKEVTNTNDKWVNKAVFDFVPGATLAAAS